MSYINPLTLNDFTYLECEECAEELQTGQQKFVIVFGNAYCCECAAKVFCEDLSAKETEAFEEYTGLKLTDFIDNLSDPEDDDEDDADDKEA